MTLQDSFVMLGNPMNKLRYQQVKDLLLAAKQPIFISDRRIDGDCLGAALAMADFMKQHGKKVPVYVSGAISAQYRAMPYLDLCSSDKKIFANDKIDLVVSFDCSEKEYVAELVQLIPAKPKVVNFDHHLTNPHFGDVNVVDVDAPATSEMVYRFFIANNTKPSKDAATCMLIGISYDTTMFSNSATNSRALEAAAQLVRAGARIQDTIRSLFKNRSIAILRIWGLALERLQQHKQLPVIATYIAQKDLKKDKVSEEEIGSLSNFLGFVSKTDTIFVMHETSEKGIKVSMRSLTQDVSKMAKKMGGGGHARAAGFTVPDICFDDLQEDIWPIVEQALAGVS